MVKREKEEGKMKRILWLTALLISLLLISLPASAEMPPESDCLHMLFDKGEHNIGVFRCGEPLILVVSTGQRNVCHLVAKTTGL